MSDTPNANAAPLPPVEPPIGPTPARTRRGVRIALVVSVMLNVLLIGIMAGGVMRVARLDPMTMTQPDFRSLWHALPTAARNDLRSMAHRDGFPGHSERRPSREERRARATEVNTRILEMLRTEPFDGPGFSALLGGEREFFARRLNAAQSAFAQQVAALTPQQRLQMAQTLTEAWQRRAAR